MIYAGHIEFYGALGAGSIGRATELRILHAPGACDIREAERCTATLTVECADRLAPGIGIRAIGVAFDQQWQPERDLLAGVAGLGVEVTALRNCVATEREVDARLAAHAEAARRHGFVAAPAGFVVVGSSPPRENGSHPLRQHTERNDPLGDV